LASNPAGRPLDVNDTRMSGDEFEISYPSAETPPHCGKREARTKFPQVENQLTTVPGFWLPLSRPRKDSGQDAGILMVPAVIIKVCSGEGTPRRWPWSSL
jgi:hypothetical protein